MERADLHNTVQHALRARAIENSGRLHPAHLRRLGSTLADALLDGGDNFHRLARQLVESGLALSSVLAAGTALQRAFVAGGAPDQALRVADAMARMAVEIDNANIELVRQEQEKIRQAVTRVLEEQRTEIEQQRAEAARLSTLVNELSTPIVPLYRGILVLPLIGAIDSRRANELMERLLGEITRHRADCVIIDITGVAVVDTGVAQHLLQTARAASLLGTTVIFTGIGPEIAQTVVQLGIELQGVATLRDLEAGITFALRRRSLAIQTVRSA